MIRFVLLALFVRATECSGFLELSFKSDFNLKAFVNISSTESTSLILIPFTVTPNKTEQIPSISIDFEHKEYTLSVFVINEDKPDIDNSTITTKFSPNRGILSPLTVMFPFSGVRINARCDSKWYGEKCDQFCCSETAERVGKECNAHGMLACPAGKRGLDCAQRAQKKWCKCKNGGSCTFSFGKNLSEKLQCECPIGFSGHHCEREIPALELVSTYGVDPLKFQIGTAKMLYESVVDNEFVEVVRPHSTHILHNLKINDA